MSLDASTAQWPKLKLEKRRRRQRQQRRQRRRRDDYKLDFRNVVEDAQGMEAHFEKNSNDSSFRRHQLKFQGV